MRRKKDRSKQGQTNKKAKQHSTPNINRRIIMYLHVTIVQNIAIVYEKEERKKQARSNKQTRLSNTAHPRQSLFLEKMSCLRQHVIMYIHVHVFK